MNNQFEEPQPLPIANSLLANPEALHQALSNDGFLFFKQIISKQKILDLRREVTDILADEGIIASGDETIDARAIAKSFREGDEQYFKAHDRLIKLEAFHSLAHDRNLMALMRSVLGESAFPHPLSIIRLIFPKNTPATTPPHQDFPNNQGSEKLTAACIQLGDCPRELGPL